MEPLHEQLPEKTFFRHDCPFAASASPPALPAWTAFLTGHNSVKGAV